MLGVSSAHAIIAASTSAHPSLLMAGNAKGLPVHMLYDRCSAHALGHGRQLAEAIWQKDVEASTQNQKKRLLATNDFAVFEGPTLSSEARGRPNAKTYPSKWFGPGCHDTVKQKKYFTSCDPHHDIYRFSYWQIFWHSI